MKDETEISLLQIRQGLKDTLTLISTSSVIRIDLYKRAMVRFEVCEEMLREYRRRKFFGELGKKKSRRGFL